MKIGPRGSHKLGSTKKNGHEALGEEVQNLFGSIVNALESGDFTKLDEALKSHNSDRQSGQSFGKVNTGKDNVRDGLTSHGGVKLNRELQEDGTETSSLSESLNFNVEVGNTSSAVGEVGNTSSVVGDFLQSFDDISDYSEFFYDIYQAVSNIVSFSDEAIQALIDKAQAASSTANDILSGTCITLSLLVFIREVRNEHKKAKEIGGVIDLVEASHKANIKARRLRCCSAFKGLIKVSESDAESLHAKLEELETLVDEDKMDNDFCKKFNDLLSSYADSFSSDHLLHFQKLLILTSSKPDKSVESFDLRLDQYVQEDEELKALMQDFVQFSEKKGTYKAKFTYKYDSNLKKKKEQLIAKIKGQVADCELNEHSTKEDIEKVFFELDLLNEGDVEDFRKERDWGAFQKKLSSNRRDEVLADFISEENALQAVQVRKCAFDAFQEAKELRDPVKYFAYFKESSSQFNDFNFERFLTLVEAIHEKKYANGKQQFELGREFSKMAEKIMGKNYPYTVTPEEVMQDLQDLETGKLTTETEYGETFKEIIQQGKHEAALFDNELSSKIKLQGKQHNEVEKVAFLKEMKQKNSSGSALFLKGVQVGCRVVQRSAYLAVAGGLAVGLHPVFTVALGAKLAAASVAVIGAVIKFVDTKSKNNEWFATPEKRQYMLNRRLYFSEQLQFLETKPEKFEMMGVLNKKYGIRVPSYYQSRSLFQRTFSKVISPELMNQGERHHSSMSSNRLLQATYEEKRTRPLKDEIPVINNVNGRIRLLMVQQAIEDDKSDLGKIDAERLVDLHKKMTEHKSMPSKFQRLKDYSKRNDNSDSDFDFNSLKTDLDEKKAALEEGLAAKCAFDAFKEAQEWGDPVKYFSYFKESSSQFNDFNFERFLTLVEAIHEKKYENVKQQFELGKEFSKMAEIIMGKNYPYSVTPEEVMQDLEDPETVKLTTETDCRKTFKEIIQQEQMKYNSFRDTKKKLMSDLKELGFNVENEGQDDQEFIAQVDTFLETFVDRQDTISKSKALQEQGQDLLDELTKVGIEINKRDQIKFLLAPFEYLDKMDTSSLNPKQNKIRAILLGLPTDDACESMLHYVDFCNDLDGF